MNIFEKLDIIINSINGINESKVSYEDIPISPNMATAEQADEHIREYFRKMLMGNDKMGGDDKKGTPEPPIKSATPPPPPISKKGEKSSDGEKSKSWESEELEWDEDDYLKKIELGEEDLDDDEKSDKDEEDYDDFLDKKSSGSSSGDESGEGGRGDDEDGDSMEGDSTTGEGGTERDEDYEDDKTGGSGEESSGESGGESDGDFSKTGEKSGKESDGKSSMEKTGKSDDSIKTSGKSGKESDGKSTKSDDKKEGESGKSDEKSDGESSSGKSGDSKDELEKTIEDAINKLKEKEESEKRELNELLDMLKSEKTDVKDIERKEKEIEDNKAKGKEKINKLESLIGKLEKPASKKEIEDEIEASKLSEKEIESLKSETINSSSTNTLPNDSELESLKKEAMKELNDKCKGKSKLSLSILYHSLKNAKIDKEDWTKIIENILEKKSANAGREESKTKKVILGDKKHIWRDVRYGYKEVVGGADTKSIYCFVDYSGSVKSRPGLIISFLGKVLELCNRLEYTDLVVYTFGNKLSVPRIINHDMLKKDGYEKVLANTIEFFNLPENQVGLDIENFSDVGYEINKIKRKDKHAVAFIFGDGVWTFYGNSNPPTKLKEICPRWIKDIVAFIFYDEEYRLKYLSKEISLLKDVVGIKDVIVTQSTEMKEIKEEDF